MSDAAVRPASRRRPAGPTSHCASRDIEASIAWYTEFTTLEVLARNQDEFGFGVWLAHPDQSENPFVLVLAQFLPATDPFAGHPQEVLAPFAHLGIELPTRRRSTRSPHGARRQAASRCRRNRCRRRSATCACSRIRTATASSTPTTKACTGRSGKWGTPSRLKLRAATPRG